jgi:hypothetical protein
VPNRLIAESLRAPDDAAEADISMAPETARSAIRPVRGPATEWLREQTLESLGARSAVADNDRAGGEAERPRVPREASDEPPITQSVKLSEVRLLHDGRPSADAEQTAAGSDAIGRRVDAGEQSVWRPRDGSAIGLWLVLGGLFLVAGGSYVGYRSRVISSRGTGPDTE